MPAVTATPAAALSLLAPGAQVVVRDEEWLVRAVQQTAADGFLVRVIGTSELVRDTEATFFTELDNIQPLRPEDTVPVVDDSPGFRRSRLHLEALLRRTPLPRSENRMAVGHRQLLDELDYQRRPVQLALEALRPRLLIADAVGLGKTLEVGMLLAELIRRGRGARILVVTPRHILEQFQHELWTRFAIPLVRLDSEGLQRVRQKIPATRNPFTFFKRAIISIDTLKNTGRYRHHLEGIRWDAVVIDECHSLINAGTLNNQLARVLAPRTEALILTSATPHNGKAESFAELVRMLDPTAIANRHDYTRDEIAHLYVRRHKSSPDVADEVGAAWADRAEPEGLHVAASPAEDAVFAELADTWLRPAGGKTPVSGAGSTLFPYTLLKAFLSSHLALAETIANRRATLAKTIGANDRAPSTPNATDVTSAAVEDEALQRLAELTAQIGDAEATKLAALADALRAAGVGGKSATRAVVFSERHATLDWLARSLPPLLGLGDKAVRVLHGGLADIDQQDVVEEFALADSPVRLLLTGDIASEGVNLHRQCHLLFHFDLPWSLITIEQRNGRIDRYGQHHSPEIRAVLLTTDHPSVKGDLDVLERLLSKEHEAHKALGDAGSLMGLHSAAEEEREITKAVAEGADADEVIPAEPANPFDLLMMMAGESTEAPVATFDPVTLFSTDADFVDEALAEAFDDPVAELGLHREPESGLLSLVPPEDLCRRLEVLPQSYLKDLGVLQRLRVTSDRDVARKSLDDARESSESLWPRVVHLSSQHPLVDWLCDKALVTFGRNEAPVLLGDVHTPTFLVQGVYSNKRGQPTVVEWLGIDRLPDTPSIRPLRTVFKEAKVDAHMVNPGGTVDVAGVRECIPAAVAAGRVHMAEVRDERDAALATRLVEHSKRLADWKERASGLAEASKSPGDRTKRLADIATISEDTEKLIDSLSTAGDPLVRVVGVIVPAKDSR